MANTPAYDPTDPRYYDEKDLRSEVERVFSLCADCRMCVKFCGSFPKLFDAIDDYCTEGKYAEVRIASAATAVANPAFDVTPHDLVTGIITEKGIARASERELLAFWPDEQRSNAFLT